MVRTTDGRRDERHQARSAVAEARQASREARKLAKVLPRDARADLEELTASARTDVRAARKELDDHPRHAEHIARRAAARLELASLRVTAAGEAERKATVDADAKKRAKVIKRRRVQAKQVQKMARTAAFQAIVASVKLPDDREKAEADFKQVQQLSDRIAKYARR